MSGIMGFDGFFNFKYKFFAPFFAFLMVPATPGFSEPADPPVFRDEVGELSMEELSAHAATITDILETASERVEQLAASDADALELVDAVRQEITLSRRWNKHLGTILLDVAKARQALAEREREAAREIARMTAVAEEARLELIVLKDILNGHSADAADSRTGWSDGALDGENQIGDEQKAPGQMATNTMANVVAGPPAGLDEARATLVFVEKAQASAFDDIDAVRGKLIEALQTLAAARGDMLTATPTEGDDLSSEDITAWAASMAAKLSQTTERRGEGN